MTSGMLCAFRLDSAPGLTHAPATVRRSHVQRGKTMTMATTARRYTGVATTDTEAEAPITDRAIATTTVAGIIMAAAITTTIITAVTTMMVGILTAPIITSE